MTRRRAAVAAALLSIVFVAGLATPAAAHASLVSVDPADGARLDESPEVVTLTFSEDVSVGLGGVRVLDTDGDAVHDGTARADGAVVTIDLQPDLPDGTYVVSFRVLSADGHPVRGGSVFGVGDVAVDTGALGRVGGVGEDRTLDVVGALGRGLAYAGLLAGAGGVAFLVVVHRGGRERASLVWWVRVLAAIGALASLVALPVQAALGTGEGPGSLFDPGVLGEVAADGVGLGIVLALAGALVMALTVDRWPAVALTGAAVAAGSFAASGHTRAGDAVALTTVTDITHLWVVAVWGGGLLLLWRTVRARRDEPDRADTVSLVGRFSTLATAVIVLVGISGAVLGWREVGAIDGLSDTTYGRLLLAKVFVVAWVALLGAYNHRRLVPAMTQGKAIAALARLRTTIGLEVLSLVAVVAMTSVLVVVTPARTLAEGGVVERVADFGETGSAQVTISPARAGANTIHVYLFDADGRPADIAESVTLVMELPAAGIEPISREAVRAGPAHLQLESSDLAIAGSWLIDVQARVDRFTQVSDTIDVPIAS